MARSSSPFSGSSFSKEKDDRPRRSRQGRFFSPEPESSRFKFEKLPEIPKEQADTLKPPVERPDSERDFRVEIISDPAMIFEHEVSRVRWYLDEYERYRRLGYDSVIRLPDGIDPKNAGHISDDEIRAAVRREFESNRADYEAYAKELQETWSAMFQKMLVALVQVYGFIPSGTFRIVPTAYGTGGGSLKKGGAIFMKLPKYRPARGRTETEAITHEVLCHEATAGLREGTTIEDSVFASHQWHKERLMDLLGRTLLVRSGLMRREDVAMDDYAEAQAGGIVDSLYYSDPEHPNEDRLRYEGHLPDLIRAIEIQLENVPPAAE